MPYSRHKYHGHRSWNAWNITHWLSTDPVQREYIQTLYREHGLFKAAVIASRDLAGVTTPDGVEYTHMGILDAMRSMKRRGML